MTILDDAHTAMMAAPQDDALRLQFHARFADGEVFVLLHEAADADEIRPRIFDLQDGPVLLAFDTEERLAAFVGGAAPYAALPGRVVVAQLAGQGVGLGINLGVAPSEMMLDPAAVDWLAAVLAEGPVRTQARPVAFLAPGGLPALLTGALQAGLSRGAGLASAAVLAGVRYDDGRRGHMLAVLDAVPGAEAALARAVAEALNFSGLEAGELDVTFLASDAPAVARLQAVGLRFAVPRPEVVADPVPASAPRGPGTDPDRPPRLR